MRARVTALALCAIFIVAACAGLGAGQQGETTMIDRITWLGHDTFLIKGERTVITDPFQLKRNYTVDVVLITHEHRDHCSVEDVARVIRPETTIVAPADCITKLGPIAAKTVTVSPGDRTTVMGMAIEAVPAYNTNKKFHPKDSGWVGYIFTLGGERIYLAGDTDVIPEMAGFRCDIALLPVSGTYVMTASEAVEAALMIKPRIAVPMHYASIVGDAADAAEFARALKGRIATRIFTNENR